ncbi:uncharacterized protein [Pseudorasbora parva]|uniref:uncharacterized protein n=1 Tax=Pseudorasbora parva TaxID=51549 RepID=UPI00351F109B
MMLIFGLMLLLKTAACEERFCSFNQSVPCRIALGHKLNLRMMVPDTRNYDLQIQKTISSKETDPVCRVKNDKMKENECDLFNNRPEVSVINGILIINRVIRADSGTYRVQVFNSVGSATSTEDLQVIVEDHLTLIVLGCLAVILIVLVIVAYYFYKKKNQLKPTPNVSDGPESVNKHAQKKPHTDEEQNKSDVEYATINSQNMNKRKGKEEEIHYGEVTFANTSAQQSRQREEHCVYSEVQAR